MKKPLRALLLCAPLFLVGCTLATDPQANIEERWSIDHLDGTDFGWEVFNTGSLQLVRSPSESSLGFLAFSTDGLPEDPPITQAILRFWVLEISPPGEDRTLRVDHVAFSELGDTPVLLSQHGERFDIRYEESWVELDVTEAVRQDITLRRQYSQFQLKIDEPSGGGMREVMIQDGVPLGINPDRDFDDLAANLVITTSS
ncbi:MAG: hypothetical protein AAB733_00750 [Patescibacteria group bacterium]